ETYNPNYYKWTQWLFVQMFNAGLAYRGKSNVNFCPKCKTVLSDEQVIDEKCERCSTVVEKKEMEAWFIRITNYAEKLLAGHNNINWDNKVKIAQKNWIGKKEGVLVNFGEVEIFTTRIDTILGANFVVLTPNHKLAGKIKTVINPATNKEIPVFVDEYVLDSVGTGAIMGVPAYDERDKTFALKNNLPIETDFELVPDIKIGKKMTIYHLRDWLISRQRYWGAPIPMINCPKCGWSAVPEKDLPVLLPDITDYVPEGNGKGPLDKHAEFYKTTCPKCGGEAKRETDVCDTFLDSSWYELRYPSVGINDQPFDKELTKKWLPVDMYTGGPEHAVLHLMYFRFVAMVLHDLGFIPFSEPCKNFFAHGMLIKNGAKISKSKGNVINPDEYIDKYGADALRLYLMFMGPAGQGGDFTDRGMDGMRRWVERVYRIISEQMKNPPRPSGEVEVESTLNRLIRKAGVDFESRHYNTTIAKMMEFINLITAENLSLSADQIKKFLIILAPFAPHLSEELWSNLSKDSIHLQNWPEVGEIKENVAVIAVMINGKLRSTVPAGDQQTVEKLAREKISSWLTNKQIKKVVFVPGKVINFVV
ncbi:MAG: class I tRNA ligase family protein, partial [Patescibacteria group bacterium]